MTNYALLIIDMQKAYFHNKALDTRRDEVVSHINLLVNSAHEKGGSVYNVVTKHNPDRSTWTLNMLDDEEGYLFEGSNDVELVEGLRLPDAHTIVKTRDSAFFGTDLAEKLRASNIGTLVLCGVSTHSCIAQTAADAYAENFRVMLVKDAIASHDPRYHQSALALLEQEYRQEVVDSSQLISRLE